jgi:hypothetical protein
MEDVRYGPDGLNRIRMPLPHNCREDLSKHGKSADLTFGQCKVHARVRQLLSTQKSSKLWRRCIPKWQRDGTLIFCSADDGEQAISHGLVEKFYNAYDKSIHIALIISNPKIQVGGQETHSRVSLVDIVPNREWPICWVFPVHLNQLYGTSLVQVLDNPGTCPNEMVHFTYNDIPSEKCSQHHLVCAHVEVQVCRVFHIRRRRR